MNESAPKGGAGSDESHRASCCSRQDSPSGTPCERGCVRTGSSNADANQSYPRYPEVALAPDAVVCGSLGCRETEPLLSVTEGSDSRVLCADCVVEFVEGEEVADG
jgi:hypothetical protein